jgi:hypothetical protein
MQRFLSRCARNVPLGSLSDILAIVRDLARSEGREIQALVEEALTDLIKKRRQGKPRSNVMVAY